jgi:ribonuclease BN (tRNA processing enzyme)
MTATWTVLGAGSILPRAGYGCAGYALRPGPEAKVTLFDCGPGSIRALGAANLALRDVERVVVSHFHTDHCLDLFALAFARHNPAFQPAPPIEILGPRGLARLLERGADALGASVRDPDATILEVTDPHTFTLERPDFSLRCLPTGHTAEALAWRCDLAQGGSLAYSGDSGEVPALVEIATGVDLFVCECSFPDDQGIPQHLTPASAGRVAARAACRRLLLTHFYPSLHPEDARAGAARHFGGPIELARDGSVHAVP